MKIEPDHYFTLMALSRTLHNLVEEHHLPGLAKYGVKTSDLENICRLTAVKTNPIPLVAGSP
ncbi:MAG: hypothetical protein MZV63_58235 [Marinilabiliales bacterium]|nr:hypothetical protein [Marinilabiliales bacterium]